MWGVIIKMILPSSYFNGLAINEKEMTDVEETQTINSQLRRSFR